MLLLPAARPLVQRLPRSISILILSAISAKDPRDKDWLEEGGPLHLRSPYLGILNFDAFLHRCARVNRRLILLKVVLKVKKKKRYSSVAHFSVQFCFRAIAFLFCK